MSAFGNFMPTMFVFPLDRENKELLDDAPPGSTAEYHLSGWMQTEIFLKQHTKAKVGKSLKYDEDETRSGSESSEENCIYCQEIFSHSKAGEGWVKSSVWLLGTRRLRGSRRRGL
jgi:hypothetical protein